MGTRVSANYQITKQGKQKGLKDRGSQQVSPNGRSKPPVKKRSNKNPKNGVEEFEVVHRKDWFAAA